MGHADERRLAIEKLERSLAEIAGTDRLGLVAKGGTWYPVARTPHGLRTFRVSRIENARLLDEGFERPARFDLAAHWNASTEELRQGRERYQVTLRLAPDAAVSFQKWRRAASAPPSDEPGSEGWVTLDVPFDDEAQAAFVVLGLGPGGRPRRGDCALDRLTLRDRDASLLESQGGD